MSHTSSTSSWGQMASSSLYADVVELGKRLVQQLGAAGDDVLSMWMAHHVADLIHAAETAPPANRAERRLECAEAIAHLWVHRAEALREHRPFADFDAVLSAIKRLDPHAQGGLEEVVGDRRPKMRDSTGQQWLEVAIGVDRAATQISRWCLGQAIELADPDTATWLQLVEQTRWSGRQELLIRYLVTLKQQDSPEELAAQERARLAAMRDKLNAMESLARFIGGELDTLLKAGAPAPSGLLPDDPMIRSKQQTTPTATRASAMKPSMRKA